MTARKLLRLSGIVLLSLVVALALILGAATAYIYFNEDKIYALLIDDMNEDFTGHLDVAWVDVSPFENFPYISIGLHQVDFYGDDSRAEPPILHAEHMYAGFDIYDMLKGQYNIKKLKITEGYLRLVVDHNGDFNLSRALAGTHPDEEEVKESPLHLDLKAVHIDNFRIEEVNLLGNKYIDLMLAMVDAQFSSVSDFIRIGFKGDLVLQEYTAEAVTLFREKPFTLDTRFTYDVVTELLVMLPGKLVLEYGSLDFSGSVDFLNDLTLDIDLYGQKKNFDVFISFAPNEITELLNSYRNEGDIYFRGNISGPTLNANPSIDIELGCENTFFFHKNDSKALRDLSFSGRFHTGAKNSLETSELTITNMYGVPESGEFRGTFKVVNFVNPILSLDFKADLDLENFQSFYDPEWLEYSAGKVLINITLQEYVDKDSVIHMATRLEDGTLSSIAFQNASMKLADYHHPLENLNGRIELDGDNVVLRNLGMKLGNSDLLMTAKLLNLNAIAHHQDAKVDFSLHVESNRIDMASLLPKEQQDTAVAWTSEVITGLVADFDLRTTSEALFAYKYFPMAELDIRKFTAHLEGFGQPIRKVAGKIKTSDERILLDDLTLEVGDNDLHVTLLVEEPGLFMDQERRGASHMNIDVSSRLIDFKNLLVYRGKSLLDPDLEAELGDERIRDLRFVCDGYIHPSTLSANGVRSYCNVEKLHVQLNDLPPLKGVGGKLRTDTTGCLYIDGLDLRFGSSHLFADLELRHLLDSMASRREVFGRIGGDRWDFDELAAASSSQAARSKKVDAPVDSLTQAELHQPAFNIFAIPFPVVDVTLDVREIINERYHIKEVKGHFKADRNHMVWIDTLHFKAAGGAIGIGGYLNGSVKDDLYLSGAVQLHDVDIDQVFFKMDNFGQDYLVSEQVHGRMSGRIDAKAHLYPDLTPMLDRTEAQMSITITEGRLENFSPMQAMGEFMGDRDLNNIRFAEMENSFTYTNGVLVVPKMKIASTLGYIHLSGKQDLDERIDYEIQVPLSLVKSASWNMMRNKLASGKRSPDRKALEEVEEAIVTEQKGLVKGYMTVKVTGTVDNFDVGLGKNRKL